MLLLSPRSELSNTAGVGFPLSAGSPKLRTHDIEEQDECDRAADGVLEPAVSRLSETDTGLPIVELRLG